MGGKNNKPVRGGGGGGGAPPPEETEKPFHSAEYEQQKLDELLNPVERPTWD